MAACHGPLAEQEDAAGVVVEQAGVAAVRGDVAGVVDVADAVGAVVVRVGAAVLGKTFPSKAVLEGLDELVRAWVLLVCGICA